MRFWVALFPPLVVGATLVATPLPLPDPPSPRDRLFGDRGFVTRAELEGLRFRSVPVKFDDRPGRSRFDVGVHMPRTTFAFGEPIPCYFIVRNRADDPIGLDLRLDLSGVDRGIENSAEIHLRDVGTGVRVPYLQRSCWVCGDGPRVQLKESGCYVARGDLSRTPGGRLPPGRYEVCWVGERVRSQPVRFHVRGPATADEKELPRLATSFVELRPRNDQEQLERIDDDARSEYWGDVRFTRLNPGDVAAALALGHEGRWYPDARQLPARDELAHVTAEWSSGKRFGDWLRVTVSPNDPSAVVWLGGEVHLMLQFEGTETGTECRVREELEKGLKASLHKRLPHTIDVHLPKGWLSKGGLGGKGRVAVVATTERVESPRGLVAKLKRLERVEDGRVWRGLLRSEWREVEFPANAESD